MKKPITKDSFILFKEHEELFLQLSKEQAGDLILYIFEYERTGIIPEFKESCIRLAFIPIRQSLDRNREKYRETCEKNSKNAQKRWGNNKVECDRIIQDTTNADNDSEYDNESESDLSNSNYSEIEKKLNLVLTSLTNQEYSDLVEIYTKKSINQEDAVKSLDDVLIQYDGWKANNKEISNDFAALRRWVVNSFKVEKQQTRSGYAKPIIDKSKLNFK